MMRACGPLLRASLLEVIRRKDAWVLAILSALQLVGLAVLGAAGLDTRSAGELLVGLAWTVHWVLSAVLAVLLGSRALSAELEQGTLLPLLARAVSRGEVLAGKLVGAWVTASLASLVLSVVPVFVAWAVDRADAWGSVQTIAARLIGLGVIVGLAAFLSLVAPYGLAVAATVVLGAAAPAVLALLRHAEAVAMSPVAAVIIALARLVPHPGHFDLGPLCASGALPLGPVEALWMCAHGLCVIAGLMVGAAVAFGRRSL